MARNKYPEETVKKILEVAQKLFIEKGYENTSIQDITDNLGGLSKGAIYHHFKSKDAILIAVCDSYSEEITYHMNKILYDKQLTGGEKLKKMFMASWKNDEQRQFMAAMPNLIDNPRLLAQQFRMTIDNVVPNFIYPVIREGVYDGSIKCDCPLETANLLMLLSNFWFNPLIYPLDKEDMGKKLALAQRILDTLGIDLMGSELTEHINGIKKYQDQIK